MRRRGWRRAARASEGWKDCAGRAGRRSAGERARSRRLRRGQGWGRGEEVSSRRGASTSVLIDRDAFQYKNERVRTRSQLLERSRFDLDGWNASDESESTNGGSCRSAGKTEQVSDLHWARLAASWTHPSWPWSRRWINLWLALLAACCLSSACSSRSCCCSTARNYELLHMRATSAASHTVLPPTRRCILSSLRFESGPLWSPRRARLRRRLVHSCGCHTMSACAATPASVSLCRRRNDETRFPHSFAAGRRAHTLGRFSRGIAVASQALFKTARTSSSCSGQR